MTRPVTRPVIARDALGTLTKLGQGGQGIVYQAPKVKTKFADAMVFKEYKPHARTGVSFEALSAMPTLVEDILPYHDGQGLVSIAAWPCSLVENGTGPTGFVMPTIPDLFAIDLTTVKGISRTTAGFQHLLNPPSVLTARGITLTDEQRYQLLREVAKALAFLHRIGVCVGDISPKNVLFSLNPRPAVYFIDCDTMRVNGVSALPQVETPDWEVPAGEELATVYSDTYKLGLLALRLLAGDQHTKDAQQLPLTTPKPLRQLITDTLANEPDRRPLPEAWAYLLGNVIEETQDRAPAPQAPTQPKPLPTHKPEPQPVVRTRPTATPGENHRVAATVSTWPTPASTQPATSSNAKKAWAILAAGALFLIMIIVLANSCSHGSSPSPRDVGSSPSTHRPSTAPAPTSTPPSLTFGTPPNLLQEADHGDARCVGGFRLSSDGTSVAPARSLSSDHYTSCGFAIAVGQSYLASSPDYISPSRISVSSPNASCLAVRNNHPNVDCDGGNFVMRCQMEGTNQAMWIACRGGNDAIVYIY